MQNTTGSFIFPAPLALGPVTFLTEYFGTTCSVVNNMINRNNHAGGNGTDTEDSIPDVSDVQIDTPRARVTPVTRSPTELSPPVTLEPLPQRTHVRVTRASARRLKQQPSILSLPTNESHNDSFDVLPCKHVCKQVTFDLQNGNSSDDGAGPSAQETTGAQTQQAMDDTQEQSLQDVTMAPQQEDRIKNYVVIKEATPTWKLAMAARRESGRFYERALALKAAMNSNKLPLWCYGLTQCPEWLKPLPAEFKTMLDDQAMSFVRRALLVAEDQLHFHNEQQPDIQNTVNPFTVR